MNDAPDVITVLATTCPGCRSPRLRTYRTMPPAADGSVIRYVQCIPCARKFKTKTRVDSTGWKTGETDPIDRQQ